MFDSVVCGSMVGVIVVVLGCWIGGGCSLDGCCRACIDGMVIASWVSAFVGCSCSVVGWSCGLVGCCVSGGRLAYDANSMQQG